jgi:SNF2 family DNA or RNA helicase
MGMMNILMQLKKVCNHPDLFIPRSEDTPLKWPHSSFLIANHFLLNKKSKYLGLKTPSYHNVKFNDLAL